MITNFEGLNQYLKNMIYDSLRNELLHACYNQDINLIINIIENTNNIYNYKNNFGTTALIIICSSKDPKQEIIDIFLNYKDIDVNIRDSYNHTAFYYACINNNLDIAKQLLNKIDTNILMIEKQHALRTSVFKKHINIVKFLLEERTDTTAIPGYISPLDIACKEHYFEIVKELLNVPNITCRVLFNTDHECIRFSQEIIGALKKHLIKKLNFLQIPCDIIKYTLEYI